MMKHVDHERTNQPNDRILCLIADLHSTLDLYYESIVENEVRSTER